jgi:hypothetical protein
MKSMASKFLSVLRAVAHFLSMHYAYKYIMPHDCTLFGNLNTFMVKGDIRSTLSCYHFFCITVTEPVDFHVTDIITFFQVQACCCC